MLDAVDQHAAHEDVVDQFRAVAKDAREAALLWNTGARFLEPCAIALIGSLEAGMPISEPGGPSRIWWSGQQLVVEISEKHDGSLAAPAVQ